MPRARNLSRSYLSGGTSTKYRRRLSTNPTFRRVLLISDSRGWHTNGLRRAEVWAGLTPRDPQWRIIMHIHETVAKLRVAPFERGRSLCFLGWGLTLFDLGKQRVSPKILRGLNLTTDFQMDGCRNLKFGELVLDSSRSPGLPALFNGSI